MMSLLDLFKRLVHRAIYELQKLDSRLRISAAHPDAQEIRRRMAPRNSLDGLMRHVEGLGFDPATVIDVGVGVGTEWLDPRFLHSARLYVEPLSEFENGLKKKCLASDAKNYVIAAAGAKAGTCVLGFDPKHLTNASMLPDGGVSRHEYREVPVVTIDSLVERFDLKGPIFLKVDVQGGVGGYEGLIEDP